MVDVTIGMPVYNGQEHLRLALDSLLAQTYPHFKLLIFDNDSTDQTQAICEAYAQRDSRIDYRRNLSNVGAFQYFNLLLEQADTPYFMWAAHDDLWAENYLDALHGTLIENPNCVLAFGNLTEIDNFWKETIPRSVAMFAARDPVFERLATLILGHGQQANLVYGLARTKDLKATDGFQLYTKHVWGVDNLLLLRLASLGVFRHTEVTTHFKRNYYEKRLDQTDFTPASLDYIQKARAEYQQVKADAIIRAHIQNSFDFILKYSPPILEYFENVREIARCAPITGNDQTILQTLINAKVTHWLTPLTDGKGHRQLEQMKTLTDMLELYIYTQAGTENG